MLWLDFNGRNPRVTTPFPWQVGSGLRLTDILRGCDVTVIRCAAGTVQLDKTNKSYLPRGTRPKKENSCPRSKRRSIMSAGASFSTATGIITSNPKTDVHNSDCCLRHPDRFFCCAHHFRLASPMRLRAAGLIRRRSGADGESLFLRGRTRPRWVDHLVLQGWLSLGQVGCGVGEDRQVSVERSLTECIRQSSHCRNISPSTLRSSIHRTEERSLLAVIERWPGNLRGHVAGELQAPFLIQNCVSALHDSSRFLWTHVRFGYAAPA